MPILIWVIIILTQILMIGQLRQPKSVRILIKILSFLSVLAIQFLGVRLYTPRRQAASRSSGDHIQHRAQPGTGNLDSIDKKRIFLFIDPGC